MANRPLERFLAKAIPFFAILYIWLLTHTMRFTYVNFEGYRRHLAGGGRILLAFWHGRLLLMPHAYEGPGITALTSASRDGEFMSRTLNGLGVETVRGSSSRGWLGGVKGLLKAARAGRDLSIVPDGPRGPRYIAEPGVVKVAARTGLPIIPMSYGASKKKVLSSWDTFIVPWPFSRGVFICGEPIEVSKDSTEAELEEKRLELESSLSELTRRADSYFCGPEDPREKEAGPESDPA